MIVKSRSMISGKETQMYIPMSEADFTVAYDRWKNQGVLVQDAFPNLNDTQREFLMTGMSEQEQQKFFDPSVD